MASTTTSSPADSVEEAAVLLRQHADDPAVRQVLAAMSIGASAPDETEPDEDDKVSKALVSPRDAIEKCGEFPEMRGRLEKAAFALEREHLARVNPRAADSWQRTRGRHHGVAV